MAGGLHVTSGTLANEAEHRLLKRWTQCVYQQHLERLEIVQEVHGLYRMLTNAYKNLGDVSLQKLTARRTICILSGLVVAGALRQGVAAAGAAVHDEAAASDDEAAVADQRVDRARLYAPRARVPAAAAEERAARATTRREAWQRQLNMDLHRRPDRGTLKLAGRVRGKTQVSSRANLPLKRVKKATTKTRKDSAAIMRRIEDTLSQPR